MKLEAKKDGVGRKMRAKSEVKNDAAELPVAVEMTDPVFIKYGPPFIVEAS